MKIRTLAAAALALAAMRADAQTIRSFRPRTVGGFVCGAMLPGGRRCNEPVSAPGQRCILHKDSQTGSINTLPAPETPPGWVKKQEAPKIWEHPVLGWNALKNSSKTRDEFDALTRPETNNAVLLRDGMRMDDAAQIGYSVRRGVSGAVDNYKFILLDGDLVSIERKYTAADAPQFVPESKADPLGKLQDAIAGSGFKWRKQNDFPRNPYTPPGFDEARVMEQTSEGVSVVITRFCAPARGGDFVSVRWEHAARRAALDAKAEAWRKKQGSAQTGGVW